jgi:nucleotide-binding universal stress UspA family protein
MKRILVATDGSDHAKRAIDLACDIGLKYGASLLLVHVLDDRPLSAEARHLAEVEFADRLARPEPEATTDVLGADRAGGLGGVFKSEDTRTATIKRLLGERILESARAEAHEHGMKSVHTVLKSGDPASAILEAAEESGANLIVLGTRGVSGIKALVLGSVSQKVNNLSPVNVITVR